MKFGTLPIGRLQREPKKINHAIAVGDVWFRAYATTKAVAEVFYPDDGLEIRYEEWHVVKLTPRGAWARQGYNGEPYAFGKPRFILADSCRWARPSKRDALVEFAARKERHVSALRADLMFAQSALEAARAELNGEVPA